MSSSHRHTTVIDVHVVILREDNRLLLGRRQGTGYEDGKLHMPAGHLEPGESLVEAVCREALEELGIRITPEHPELVHVMHRKIGGGRIATFFLVREWTGDVRNAEPHKCRELTWACMDSLPQDIVSYGRDAINAFRVGLRLSFDGWELGR